MRPHVPRRVWLLAVDTPPPSRYASPMADQHAPKMAFVPNEALREEVRRQRAAVADSLILALGDDVQRGSLSWWNYYYAGKFLGEEGAHQLVHDARAADASGGMIVGDGSRKRTLGGVFFRLAKKKFGRRKWDYMQWRSAIKAGVPPFRYQAKPKDQAPASAPVLPPAAPAAESCHAEPVISRRRTKQSA
jgi:hypothetical protein